MKDLYSLLGEAYALYTLFPSFANFLLFTEQDIVAFPSLKAKDQTLRSAPLPPNPTPVPFESEFLKYGFAFRERFFNKKPFIAVSKVQTYASLPLKFEVEYELLAVKELDTIVLLKAYPPCTNTYLFPAETEVTAVSL